MRSAGFRRANARGVGGSAPLMAATLHLMEHFRAHWRALKRGRPGRRFQERYERARHGNRRATTLQRLALIVAAVLCLAIAVVLSIIPGPAIPFFFVAGGLLATESRYVARLMDWFEVRGRAAVAWGKRKWRAMPSAGRILVVLMGACCSLAVSYVGFRLLTG